MTLVTLFKSNLVQTRDMHLFVLTALFTETLMKRLDLSHLYKVGATEQSGIQHYMQP